MTSKCFLCGKKLKDENTGKVFVRKDGKFIAKHDIGINCLRINGIREKTIVFDVNEKKFMGN